MVHYHHHKDTNKIALLQQLAAKQTKKNSTYFGWSFQFGNANFSQVPTSAHDYVAFKDVDMRKKVNAPT